jgi:predicted NAD-dependent protein-ADP-ribosyltransferase YbiA (DUF1768 family)
MKAIEDFTGPYSFLALDYPCTIKILGKTYKSAQDALKEYKRRTIGDSIEKKKWKNERESIMITILMAKYIQNVDLRLALLNTRGADIVCKSDNGDTFWGITDGYGQNKYGKITVTVRNVLSEEVGSTSETNLQSRIKVSNGTITIYGIEGSIDYPLSLYKLAAAYMNMDYDTFAPNTNNETKVVRYQKNLLSEVEFMEVIEDIIDNYDVEDPDDRELIQFYVHDAIKYLIRDMGFSNALQLLEYTGF